MQLNQQSVAEAGPELRARAHETPSHLRRQMGNWGVAKRRSHEPDRHGRKGWPPPSVEEERVNSFIIHSNY